MVGDPMYGKGCGVDEDPIDWALQQLNAITNTRPLLAVFMRYMNDNWSAKAAMWCVGARRIPHACQNINVAIESYHSNLKSILNSTKERFVGRRMDWLIYHLTRMSSHITGMESNARLLGLFETNITRVLSVLRSSAHQQFQIQMF
jgi:hypothetical protein